MMAWVNSLVDAVPQVTGHLITGLDGRPHGLANALRFVLHAEILQHLDGGEDHRGGVGDVLAGDVRRRAVYRFEDGGPSPMLAPGAMPSPHQTGTEIRENVAEQVGGDHHIEAFRVHHQVHAGGVDDHLLVLDVRVAGRDLTGHFQEQAGGGLEDVGLVDDGDLLASFLARQLEGEGDDALGPSRVMMLIASALWLSSLRFWPAPEYMPSVFSRTVMMSMLS